MTSNGWKPLKVVGKWAFAALFIAGGIGHFVATDLYSKIMPPYLPSHRALVLLSGVFEVALGLLLLVPATSRLAAWGLVALLVAVFPANVFMAQHPERFGISPTLLLLRLPSRDFSSIGLSPSRGGETEDERYRRAQDPPPRVLALSGRATPPEVRA